MAGWARSRSEASSEWPGGRVDVDQLHAALGIGDETTDARCPQLRVPTRVAEVEIEVALWVLAHPAEEPPLRFRLMRDDGQRASFGALAGDSEGFNHPDPRAAALATSER